MKIEVLKENLKTNLSIIERVVGKNLSLPILNNVLVVIDGNYLNLVSTDLEIAVRLWILVKIIEKGRVVVPAKFLSSFIASLPNEKIIMESRQQNLYIECKNFKTQIQGFNPEEFPIIPEFKDIESFDVDSQKLYQGLSQVVDLASPTSTRPEISGIYFSFSKNTIKVVATDSFRLGEKNITTTQTIKKDQSFILPQKTARELMGVLENSQGSVKICVAPNQVLFELAFKDVGHPQVQITSRLIEGEYPNYQDIIPTKFKTHITLKRDEFLNQIKTASLFSGKVSEVKISVNHEKQEVEIFAKSPDVGENKSNFPAVVEGDSMIVSFNYKYLVDGLVHIKSSEVLFEISKEEGPCILRAVGDSSYTYVAMPIKQM